MGNLVRGNTFVDTRTTGGEPTIEPTDELGGGCYGNHIIANTIDDCAAGSCGVIVRSSGTGPNYTSDNILDYGFLFRDH